jgi:hypothetical protein
MSTAFYNGNFTESLKAYDKGKCFRIPSAQNFKQTMCVCVCVCIILAVKPKACSPDMKEYS